MSAVCPELNEVSLRNPITGGSLRSTPATRCGVPRLVCYDEISRVCDFDNDYPQRREYATHVTELIVRRSVEKAAFVGSENRSVAKWMLSFSYGAVEGIISSAR